GELAAAADLIGEGGDGSGLVVARLGPQLTLEQSVLVDQPIDLLERGRVRGTGYVADGRPADEPSVLPAEVLERPPREHREQEIVIVELILGNGDLEKLFQHLHGGESLQQVEEVVVAGIVDAA